MRQRQAGDRRNAKEENQVNVGEREEEAKVKRHTAKKMMVKRDSKDEDEDDDGLISKSRA